MITLDTREARIDERLRKLKDEAGSHSPSVITLAEKIPELRVAVDACFLSNPLATDVFLKYFKRDLLDTHKIRDVIEFYPSQNQVIAGILASYLGVKENKIFIGNGATEIIQAILHKFTKQKILVNIPTFSPYYEFAREDVQVVYHQLRKEEDFKLDVKRYLELVKKEKPDTVVLINPNNPDGGYIPTGIMRELLEGIPEVKNVIVDESFIHFAFEDSKYELKSVADLVERFPNLMIVKSMSKDFGVAGIRAGYAIMSEERVATLLKNGFLWNSNGLNEYFFRLYTQKDFNSEYEEVRVRYIKDTQEFIAELGTVPGIKVYPTRANFALVELLDGSKASTLVAKLLISHGIYARTCSDKIGLNGEFLRVSSRTRKENDLVIRAFCELYR